MKRMEKTSEPKFRIQALVNGKLLSYNVCQIIDDSGNWLEFKDKFDTHYKYNKNVIISMEELK